MSLAERIAQWPEQWRQEGIAEGRQAAEARRAAQERALLRRLATVRFGSTAGERVAALLGNTEDWDRLSTVAELIVTAEDGADLASRAATVLRQAD